MSEMTDAWIQTFDGKQFFPQAPDPDLIDPRVIATVLSRLPRFGGHTMTPYSVAQHSIGVWGLVKPELRLPALLHDAHEAYTGFGDVASPMKRAIRVDDAAKLEHMQPQFAAEKHDPDIHFLDYIEHEIDKAIAKRFGFDPVLFYHDDIRHADAQMCATEKKFLMLPEPSPWVEMPEPLSYTHLFSSRSFVRMSGEFLRCMEQEGAYEFL